MRPDAGAALPLPSPGRGRGAGRGVLALKNTLAAASLALILAPPLWAREVVDASPPTDVSVTIYRDPDRGEGERLRRDNPQGIAMISETRRVTLPPGETTIRFEGVAEGMIGISAIVTGLPGGTIEKNRNAQLLSPAALVDGTLGNRVTITRTNPATGVSSSEQAVVRTRADGGLVLQTSQGFEAVRCSGLPESLAFDRVPAGLSAAPVFSVDTRSAQGGTFDVTLTYLSWGFDWQADYVASLGGKAGAGEFGLDLLSWLTLVNDNGQGFDQARLQIVAGKLNVTSDYRSLADPPVAEPLALTCYPFGSTSAGSPVPEYGWKMPPPRPVMAPPPPPPPPPPAMVVTGARMSADVAMITATEENLGDLKLYRVPGRVDVAARGMKQVAFLDKPAVRARLLYQAPCDPFGRIGDQSEPQPAGMLLVTRNEEAKGLGIALPQGALTLYEPAAGGERLAGMAKLRDYARGQDVELDLAPSTQVFARCAVMGGGGIAEGGRWIAMRAALTNANPHPVQLRLQLGWAGQFEIRFPGQKVVVKNGYQAVEVTVPANSERSFDWELRPAVRN